MTGEAISLVAEIDRRGRRIAGDALLAVAALRFELRVRHDDGEPERVEVAYDEVRELSRADACALELELHRDGRIRLTLPTASEAAALEEALLARCRTLPELTRALRSLGRRRGDAATAAAADRFFEPLLAARRAAAAGGIAESLAAFRGAALTARLEHIAEAFAIEHHPERPSARRALEARLMERLEPLESALRELDAAAGELATAGAPPIAAWREWTRRLRLVFERADDCWTHLAAELAPLHGGRVSGRRNPR